MSEERKPGMTITFAEARAIARPLATQIAALIINEHTKLVPDKEANAAPFASLVAEMAFQNTLLFLSAHKWAPGSKEGEEFLRTYYRDAADLAVERWRSCPFLRASVAGMWEKK